MMLGFLIALVGAVVGAQALESGGLAQADVSPPEQVGQDWSLGRLPDSGGLIAFTDYDNGVAIAFQCRRGVLSATIAGLPPAEGLRRVLRIGIDGAPPTDAYWLIGAVKTVAFSPFPGLAAREYRKGGAVRIGVPGAAANGATLVYAINLPASAVAIDAVLEECGLPTEDPLDALIDRKAEGGLPTGLEWDVRPRQPRLGRARHARGYVGLVCLTDANGGLDECRVDAEMPLGSGFGDASLRAVRSARVKVVDDQPLAGRRVAVPFYFMINGYRAPVPTRISPHEPEF